MKTTFLFLAIVLLSYEDYAQSDSQYTQYMYNTASVNPAYAGSRGILSVFGLYRTQWVGLEGAPKTANFSISAPIKNSNFGVGLTFINDMIGPTVQNAISTDVSYTLQMSERFKLGFGLKATGNLYNLDVTKLDPKNANDPYLQSLSSSFSPNFGTGLYLYSNKSYFGVSIPHFFDTKRYDDNATYVYKERMNLSIIGGYVFDLSNNLKFKPAFLSKIVEGTPAQLDVSGNFLINDKIVLGMGWRWSAAASAMAGFQINDSWFIGYGYDSETTHLSNYSSGSHEIFLRYELFKKTEKVYSPRFF